MVGNLIVISVVRLLGLPDHKMLAACELHVPCLLGT